MKKRFEARAWMRRVAGRIEVLMFTLAMLFLVCLAVLVVIWVDVPALKERAESVVDAASLRRAEKTILFVYRLEGTVLFTMALIWIAVFCESIVHWVTRPWNGETRRHHWYSLMFCLCPALRMCARSPEMNHRIWLPGLGWRQGGRRLQRQLERHLSVPMMVIALLLMPILVIEFFMKDQVAAYGWLRLTLHIGTGVIWFAFAAEFILMVSIAEKKLEYCKEHWIDLAIVLLPILYFLRTLSVARTTRLASLMRVQQISNLARAYRLRGTAIKALRVLILFNLAERVLRISDERKIEKLEQELAEMDKHSRLLRQRIAKLKIKKSTSDPIAMQPEDSECIDTANEIRHSADQARLSGG